MSEWTEEPVVFTCEGDRMLAILHRPAARAGLGRIGVLVVVGGPQYRVGSHRQFTLLARGLAAAGIPVMRFDYRGLGDSDGAQRTFMEIRDDIRAAIDAFRLAAPSIDGVVLWGLCDAASAILMHAVREPRVAGLVLVNPESRTAETEAQAYLHHYYAERFFQKTFWTKVVSGRVNVLAAARGLLETVRKASRPGTQAGASSCTSYVDRMREGLQEFRGPVLLLLSGRDLTARAFEQLAAAESEWKRLLDADRVKLVRLPDADHTFSSRASLDDGTRAVVAWLREALG